MKQLTLTYPDDLEQVVELDREKLAAHIQLMASLKMFELGELSSGQAAHLAGMTRVEFLDACGTYRVPIFNYTADEIEAELRSDVDTLERCTRPAQ